MAVVPDIAGQLRGKGFPERERAKRFEDGIGWCPTCVQITSFNSIAPSPFGSLGDLYIKPDPSAEVKIDHQDGSSIEHFVLGNIIKPNGDPWECCLRSYLQSCIERLRRETGLDLVCAFEHEFHYTGADHTPASAYNLGAYRRIMPFAGNLMAALRSAGLEPDTFMPEFAPGQCEVTIAPASPLQAADQAAILREVVRATAERHGEKASFTPLRSPGGVGNGLHIHMSLWDNARPVTYDSKASHGLSRVAKQFASGILRALPSLVSLTAPSVPSYLRLVPHRWSAPFNNLGYRDREAALRVCPGDERDGRDPAKGTNLEFRASDSTASPHLQLGAIIAAGIQGIVEELPEPVVTQEDLSLLDAPALSRMGIERLPTSLEEALQRLEDDAKTRALFPEKLIDVYLAHKRHEVELMKELGESRVCDLYAEAY